VRLRKGWNLLTLAVNATNLSAQLGPDLALPGRTLRYVPADGSYTNVPAGQTAAAGTILWIYSPAAGILPVVGTYVDPAPAALSAGAHYIGNPTFSPWLPSILGLSNATVFAFASETQVWLSPPVPGSNAPAGRPGIPLPAGGVAFASTGAPATLTWPRDPRGVLYYHLDHLGSSAILADRDGNVLEENTFFAYGTPRTERSTDGKRDPYRFGQKERDPDTGLNYFEARYQSPVYARFISVDPKLSMDPAAHLGGPQGLNFYAYCLNNPYAFVDPNGTDILGSLRETVADIKREANYVASEARQFAREVGEGAAARGRYMVMTGLWFGDKDVVSVFAEVPTKIDVFDTGGYKIETKLNVGAIALDGRFTYAYSPEWSKYAMTSGEYNELEKAGVYESKTKLKPRMDTITATQGPAAMNGGSGSKGKAGVDYKLIGDGFGISPSGRLEGDFGVGVTGGGELSYSAGQVEISGKVNGTLTFRIVKKDNMMSVIIQATGYAEVQGVIRIPQLANMLQIPVRVSVEGTVQYVYTFDVDKVQRLKGL
jgi:RHS repeat-associated protein